MNHTHLTSDNEEQHKESGKRSIKRLYSNSQKMTNFIFETFLVLMFFWSYGHNASGQDCPEQGYLLRNVGSGLCLGAQHPFDFNSQDEMSDCPSEGNPLYRYAIRNESIGQLLALPYFSSSDGSHIGHKCLWTGNGEGNGMFSDVCIIDNPWQVWDFIDVANKDDFLLTHRVTSRCAQASETESVVHTISNCDANDPYMLWKFE